MQFCPCSPLSSCRCHLVEPRKGAIRLLQMCQMLSFFKTMHLTMDFLAWTAVRLHAEPLLCLLLLSVVHNKAGNGAIHGARKRLGHNLIPGGIRASGLGLSPLTTVDATASVLLCFKSHR